MWLLGTSLMLNLVLLPWEAERLGALESLSLGALSLTSLCLAAFSSSGDGMGDAVSMGLVVVVAAINTAVLAALAVELSRQATAEVIEMTGLELPPQWEIDSLRERIQVTLRQLRRRRCSRVANVSELLSTAHRVTLTLLSRRRASMLALTYKAELNRKGNEVSDRERMMHYDWDTAALSTDNSDEEGGDLHTATKDTSHHVIEYLRPATGPSDENQRSSRPRSVVFDAPDARATVWSVSSSSDAMDVGANQSDIVNPFLGTCFEDNPWDVLVRTGHDRQFLRSRDRSQQALTTFSDLGYFDDTHDAFDLDAAISIATSSASSSADHRNSSRYFLKSRERAAALARPSWALPSTDAITWADVELPGVANDVGDFDGDISVGDIDLNETRVLTTVWEEVATPSLIEFDDDDFDFRPPQQAPSVAQRAVRPQRFTSEVAARRCVAAAASMLESQLLGAARTFWAVLSDIRTATALLSIVKVQRLNQRLASLLEELYEAEFQFVHVVWSYEHYVRSGAWDAVGSANMELEGTIEKEAAQGAHTSSEDKYLSKESLDLSDYEFDASDMLHK